MVRRVRTFVFFTCIAIVALSAHSQEISEKDEVAVFSLSHYQWQIPGGALSLVDEQIKEVFISLGRFDVLGMSYRLDAEGVDQFIEKIREVKEQNIELPETVRLGQEAFTEADFNALVNSFIVVVPVMTRYQLRRQDQGGFEAQIEVSFSFIDVAKAEAFGYFTIETSGSDPSGRSAVQEAADRVAPELTFQLRTIPQFQLKTGVLEVRGRQVFLEFGTNMGVKVGDEYAIVTDTVLPSGHVISDETGLLIVNDVQNEVSVATLLYSEGRPGIGDQLKEIPRFGYDTGAVVRTVFGIDRVSGIDNVVGLIGVRQSTSRGFHTYRPIIGLDIPVSFSGGVDLPGFIVNLYGGGEINWYLWKFQIVPTAAVGLGGSIPTNDTGSFRVSHVGGFAELVVSYLLSRDIKLSISAGFTGWFSLSAAADPYFGPHLGLGATYKY